MLTNEQIKERIENAFSPLRCVVELWDYDHRIRFKVFDAEDNGILEMPEIILDKVQDKTQLHTLLSAARERVKKKSFVLNDWP